MEYNANFGKKENLHSWSSLLVSTELSATEPEPTAGLTVWKQVILLDFLLEGHQVSCRSGRFNLLADLVPK